MKLEKLIRLCEDLTPTESQISHYILHNRDDVSKLSIQELADKIYVSKSAIHRFCKKISLKGYNDLKLQLAKDSLDISKNQNMIDVNYPFDKNDSPKNIAHKLLQLYEATIFDTYEYIDPSILKKVSELMFKSSVIDIYTHAHNLNPAENFQDKMLTIGKAVNCPKSFYKQRMTALASSSNHVALILSYSGKATFIKPIIKKLYEKRVQIIMVGKAGISEYAPYVNYVLCISDQENLRDRISQFSSHIALQYMMDVIFGCIYNLDRQKNIEYLQNAISFMDDRKLE